VEDFFPSSPEAAGYRSIPETKLLADANSVMPVEDVPGFVSLDWNHAATQRDVIAERLILLSAERRKELKGGAAHVDGYRH
jgi:hypothetical protein